MKEINREHFEAWLFSQPLDKSFNFYSNTECALCAFVRSVSNKPVSVGGWFVNLWEGASVYHGRRTQIPIPKWLQHANDGKSALIHIKPLTIANLQKRYIELFGNPLSEDVCPPNTEATNETTKQQKQNERTSTSS